MTPDVSGLVKDDSPLALPFENTTADIMVNSPPGDFTIVVMPDTQHYTDNAANYAIFGAQTQWIVGNKDTRNIVFVTGLGDIVQNGNANSSEWQVADAAYGILEDPTTTSLASGIPYGLTVGNHDQTPSVPAAAP